MICAVVQLGLRDHENVLLVCTSEVCCVVGSYLIAMDTASWRITSCESLIGLFSGNTELLKGFVLHTEMLDYPGPQTLL